MMKVTYSDHRPPSISMGKVSKEGFYVWVQGDYLVYIIPSLKVFKIFGDKFGQSISNFESYTSEDSSGCIPYTGKIEITCD